MRMKDCREKAGHALARPIGGSVTWALCPAPTTPSITNSNDPPTLTSTLYSKSSDTNHSDSLMIAQINFFQVKTTFFILHLLQKKSNVLNSNWLRYCFFSPEGGVTEEYGIVELQGDLRSHSESQFEGKFIGDLHYTKDGQPILIIGHHLLYGKEVKMEKPLAFLEKRKDDQNRTEYLIRGVIKRKVIFRVRPKPIVGIS